jgi:phosphoadenosine phosphosulfate reductase
MTVLIDIARDLQRSDNGQRAAELSARYEDMTPQDILRDAIRNQFFGDITLSSSFGADSAVLLHMVSEIDPNLPVLFLDTDRHFFQTLQYRDELAQRLGLTNIINLKADEKEASEEDGKGTLWRTNPDQCCDLRKVRPLNKVMESYGAWISGRKRHQAKTRANLAIVEWDGRHFKAFRRSAASRAPNRWKRVRTPAPAVGPGPKRSNAASTTRSTAATGFKKSPFRHLLRKCHLPRKQGRN